MNYYQCKKCATLIKGATYPNQSGCSKSVCHEWYNLGAIGCDNYQCKKCATLVEMDSYPTTSGCPSNVCHEWYKLGGVTNVASKHVTYGPRSNTPSKGLAPLGCIAILFGILWAVYNQFHNHESLQSSEKSDEAPAATVVSSNKATEVRRGTLALKEQEQSASFSLKSNIAFVVGLHNGDTLNVRSTPAASSKVLFVLTNGQKVEIRGDTVFNGDTKWIPIKIGEQQGWVTSTFVQIEPR